MSAQQSTGAKACVNDVCCSARVYLTPKAEVAETYTQGQNYAACEAEENRLKAVTPAQQLALCKSNANFKSLAGTYSYDNGESGVQAGSRCDQKKDGIPTVAGSSLGSLTPSTLPSVGASGSTHADALTNTLTREASVDSDTAKSEVANLNSADPEVSQSAAKTIAQQLHDAGYSDQDINQILKNQGPADTGTISNPDSATADNAGGTSAQNPNNTPSAPSTAPQSGAAQLQCGVTDSNYQMAAYFAHAESSCGQDPRTNSNCRPDSGVCGPLQFTSGTWHDVLQQYEQTTGDYSCHNVSAEDVNCSMKVGAWNINNVVVPKIQDQCQTAGYTITSCAYTCHVFGMTGCGKVLSALPNMDQNADARSLCGGVLSTAACNDNKGLFYAHNADGSINYSQPLSVRGMMQNMDRVMGVSGAVIPQMGGGFAALLPGTVYQNPGSNPNYTQSGPQNTTAVMTNGFGGLGGNSGLSGLLLTQFLGSFSSLNSLLQRNAATVQQQASQQASQPAPSVTLSVTPPTVARGNPISVAWNSIGVSNCSITQNGAAIATGNSGSRSVATNASTTPGTMIFRILCTAPSNGQVVQQSSSVTVQ
jgi:hypothetical protein